MSNETLNREGAAVLLFGRDTLLDRDFDGAGAQFRSGADIAEALAEHFGFTSEAYEGIAGRLRFERETAESDRALPDDTELVCPGCGHNRFTAWAPTDTGYHGVRVVIQDGERTEDDSGVYDSEAGDGIGATEQYSCLGSCGGVWNIEDLRAPAEVTS